LLDHISTRYVHGVQLHSWHNTCNGKVSNEKW